MQNETWCESTGNDGRLISRLRFIRIIRLKKVATYLASHLKSIYYNLCWKSKSDVGGCVWRSPTLWLLFFNQTEIFQPVMRYTEIPCKRCSQSAKNSVYRYHHNTTLAANATSFCFLSLSLHAVNGYRLLFYVSLRDVDVSIDVHWSVLIFHLCVDQIEEGIELHVW